MRLLITHRTLYSYGTPVARAIQTLRLTPRNHDGQYVVTWRIEVDRDIRLDAVTDAFGNTVHGFTVDGPLDRLEITATGEVLTETTSGALTGQVERFPPVLFLRETTLTKPNAEIEQLASDAAGGAGDPLPRLHALMETVRTRMTYDTDATAVTTSAIEAFGLGHGVCQDFAHIFIAGARHVGFPARYVGGYLYEGKSGATIGGHGWAEAYVDGLGWVGFDPTNGTSPTESYVRVATGLDYLGAAPVRGTRTGGTGETLTVSVDVTEAGSGAPRPVQRQSQKQG